MDKIRIGFISLANPLDKRPWSGTLFKLYENLKTEDTDVFWIPVTETLFIKLISKSLRLIAKIFGKRVIPVLLKVNAVLYSKTIDILEVEKVDVLFVPIGSPFIYNLNTSKPIITMSDANPHALYDYYDDYKNLWSFNKKQGNHIEKVALERSVKIIYSSDWVKNDTIDYYKIPKEKIIVIELGANINNKDVDLISIKKEKSDTLHLLFSGVDWVRKGGDIAVDTCSLLNEIGIKSIISIIGIREIPDSCIGKEYVNFIGFLNKNVQSEYDKFISIIQQSDILLLPTKAECAGIVFAEASAFGIPSFTYDTGGTSNYIENGVNGYRLSLNCTAIDFANKIQRTIETNELELLKKGCFFMYRNKLNWDIWKQKTNKVIKEILN